MKNIAVILASGSGERLGTKIPKQFLKLGNKTIIEHTIDTFEHNKNINEIIMVINPNYMDLFNEILSKSSYKKIKKVFAGGKTRMESSYIGVKTVADEDNVLIHDGVRPFVNDRIINDCIEKLKLYNAVNTAIVSSDTILEVNEENIITHVPNRKNLRRCQTPQCFKAFLIKQAHERAIKEQLTTFTDDCGLVLQYNLAPIFVVNGEENNIKITQIEDLAFAENIIKNKPLNL